jgi:hypothetical protein
MLALMYIIVNVRINLHLLTFYHAAGTCQEIFPNFVISFLRQLPIVLNHSICYNN